jgi:hypothetical protein
MDIHLIRTVEAQVEHKRNLKHNYAGLFYVTRIICHVK